MKSRGSPGSESRQHVQLLRHSVDAIITGIGTVLADDPLLTDRSGLPRRRPLLRVILDSQLRIPLNSRLAQSATSDVLVFCADAPKDRFKALEERGISIKGIVSETDAKRPTLNRVLEELATMKITSVLIETGSQLNASFLESGLVDRLFLFYAPKFLGPEAQPLLTKAPATQPHLQDIRLHKFGQDIAIESHLNDPWQT